jgi:uncharacterized protein (DUF983 family)
LSIAVPFQPVPGKFAWISNPPKWVRMLKMTPLSVKLVLALLSVSKTSVLVCPNEKIEMKRLQIIKNIVLFMI